MITDIITGCLLDYNYFKDYYKMKAIDLSKKQVLDADAKAWQQINFTTNLDWNGKVFHYWRSKETILDFSQGTVWGL